MCGIRALKIRIAKAERRSVPILATDPVGVVTWDLLQKPGRQANARAAKKHTLARAGQRQAFLRTRHRDIAQSALLLDLLIVVAHALAGEDALLHTDNVHTREFEALRAVHRHHRHTVVARRAVQVRVECDLIQKA